MRVNLAPACDLNRVDVLQQLQQENDKLRMQVVELEQRSDAQDAKLLEAEVRKPSQTWSGIYNRFFQKKLSKLNGLLKNHGPAFSTIVRKENEQLKSQIYELSSKCKKLTADGCDLERLLNEQSSIIKALNVRKISRECLVFVVMIILFDGVLQ